LALHRLAAVNEITFQICPCPGKLGGREQFVFATEERCEDFLKCLVELVVFQRSGGDEQSCILWSIGMGGNQLTISSACSD
jgi:hypothetical protein